MAHLKDALSPLGAPPPSAAYCEALLAAGDPLARCQRVAEEMAAASGASWSAVLRVTPEARAFAVTGSVGAVPSVLHDCHNMTPAELASALGWTPGAATVQFVAGDTALARALRRGGQRGSRAAFCLLASGDAHQGLAAVGWPPGSEPPATVLATLLGIAVVAAAALRQSEVVADLRVSERTKSEFVATMSHELRNPLSAILGYTDLLAHGDFGALNEEQREILRRAHASASSLLDLINTTLEVSRFEVGDRADQSTDLDLAVILREQVEEMRSARCREDLQLAVGGDTAVPMASDPLKLRVAVRQLLEAALVINPDVPLQAVAGHGGDGCTVVVGTAAMVGAAAGVSPHDEPEATLPAPFALVVARRVAEVLGGDLDSWRDEHGPGAALRLRLPG